MLRKLLLALTLTTTPCFAAEPRARAEGDYSYIFDEDLLSAAGAVPPEARIRVRPKAARNTLIRPRTQFVVELLKSAERF